VRRLIVNADDLGYTSGINRAIFQAHASGLVTSTTLMANGPAFADACAGLGSAPHLSVGCHVMLIDGSPLSSPSAIASLVSAGSSTFRTSLGAFAALAMFGRIDPRHIEIEAAAQIRHLQSAGVSPSHIDTHKHTHIFPTVLRPLLRAARDCGIRCVRNPFGPGPALPLPVLLNYPGVWRRWAELRVLSRFAATFREIALAYGFTTPDGTLGIEVTGMLDESLFAALAQNIPPGTWEFVCHPGYDDADLAKSNTRLTKSRAIEFQVLTSPEARKALEKSGVELISYRDLNR